MSRWIRTAQQYPRLVIGLTALVIVLAGSVLVISSLSGGPIEFFSFKDPNAQEIPEDADIAGWSFLDRDSTHIGDTVKLEIRVVYHSDRVSPDLDVFESSVDILPFEKKKIYERQRSLGGDLREYVLEYTLQAVEVALDTTYQIDPSIMYYTETDQSDLRSLRIESPQIHVVSYYPDDVSKIALKELKEEIYDSAAMRASFMVSGGIVLLALCSFIIWRCGRKIRPSELIERERLWLEFQDSNDVSLDNRDRIRGYDRIFTQLLESQTGIDAGKFWSGVNPEDTFWKDTAAKARKVLRNIYHPSAPNAQQVKGVSDLLHDTFAAIVHVEKLKIMLEPTFVQRLKKQPDVLAMSGVLVVFGLLMLFLAINPTSWIPSTVARYNELVRLVQDEGISENAASEFSELAKISEDPALRAAAFYNSGTITAEKITLLNEEQLLTLEDLFDSVTLDEVLMHDTDKLFETLAVGVERYGDAELQLRGGVRADSNDEYIHRNLELVIKRRKAVLAALANLVETGHVEPMLQDELLDLIESQMALEFKIEEGDEAPGYYIGENF